MLAAAFTAPNAFAAAGSRTVTLDVEKMDCAVCPITVREALKKVPGVESAQVDLKSKRAVVTFDPGKTAPEALTQATADAGFPSKVEQLH